MSTTLSLVEFNSQHITSDTLFHALHKPPQRSLYSEAKYQSFYPTITFYRDKGIKEINIDTKIITEVTKLIDLGQTMLTDIQIMDLMSESVKVQTKCDFFYMFYNNIMAWIKTITGNDIGITGPSFPTYFGIVVINEEDKRDINKIEQEIEDIIRKQFTVPQFSTDEIHTSTCSLV